MSSERETWYNSKFVYSSLLEKSWKSEIAFIGKYKTGESNPKKVVRTLSHRNYATLHKLKALVPYDQAQKDNKGFWFYNMYRSVADFKKIPKITYNPRLRSLTTNQQWYNTEKYYSNVIRYDLFLDFDLPKKDKKNPEAWKKMLNVLLTLTEDLDKYQVKYETICSGEKGIHLIIPHNVTPRNLHFNFIKDSYGSYFGYAKRVVEDIKQKYDDLNANIIERKLSNGKIKKIPIGYIDLNNNGSPSKLRKVPLSLTESNNVCLPLNDRDLKRFKLSEMYVSEVLEFKNIRKIRGNHYFMRNHELTDKEVQFNFLEFKKSLEGGIK